MAKSKITESHSISAEGVLNVSDGIIALEVEDIGIKRLADLVNDLDGKLVKVGFKLVEEIFD